MKTTWIIVLVISLCSLPAAFAEEAKEEAAGVSSEALDILKKADEAARKIGAVRLTVTSKPTGLVANFIGATEGETLMTGWDAELQRPKMFWAHVKTTAPGAEAPIELTGGGDGDTYFLINHTAEKAYEDMDPGVLGSGGQALGAIGIAQFVHPSPYERDLGAAKVELLGREEVGGEECYKIRVEYGPQQGETTSTWSISTEDFLPRRRVRHFNMAQQGEGDLEVTLTKLEIDPQFESSLFKLKLPEGYEQIDDFAP